MQQFALNALLYAAIHAANESLHVPTLTKWAWFGFEMTSGKCFWLFCSCWVRIVEKQRHLYKCRCFSMIRTEQLQNNQKHLHDVNWNVICLEQLNRKIDYCN